MFVHLRGNFVGITGFGSVRGRGRERGRGRGQKRTEALRIERDVPLDGNCSFGIGGPAKYFAKAKSVKDLSEACSYVKSEDIKQVLVIGKGSNLLFDDRGFNGLVLVNELCFVGDIPISTGSSSRNRTPASVSRSKDRRKKTLRLRVGSGYPFNTLGQMLSSAGWSGLEFATGIPGTVGGAIYMNAGANGRDTASSLVSVEYITKGGKLCVLDVGNETDAEEREGKPQSKVGEKGKFGKVEATPGHYSYRTSPFQSMSDFFAIVAGTFELEANAEAKLRARRYMQKRSTSQPLTERSAGCVFRNPQVPRQQGGGGSGSERDGGTEQTNLSAGALIDKAGLKGVSLGSAQVSPVHANYLVSKGPSSHSSRDMKELIDLVKRKIETDTGICLQEEIRIIPYVE